MIVIRLYHKVNLNPKGNNTDDCIIRSIMLITGREWKDIFADLSNRAKREYFSMNDPHILRPYLEETGFYRVTRWKRRLLMRDVVLWTRLNKIDAIAFNAEHCVGISKGQLQDTWNSLNSMVKDIYVYGKDPKELIYDVENR